MSASPPSSEQELGIEKSNQIVTTTNSIPVGVATSLVSRPKKTRPVKSVDWLMVLASLALHSLLLLVPFGKERSPVVPKPPEKQVRITRIPTPTKAPIKRSPTPIKRPPAPRPIARPNANAIVVPSAKPQPQPQATPSPQAKPQPTPTATPTAASSPTPAPAPTPTPEIGDTSWSDFPRYPAAQPGCFELESCLQTGKPLAVVTAFFEKELPAKQYQVASNIQEADRTVYQVSRNGKTQFLSLIFTADKGTVYVLSEEPRRLADLSKAVEVPPEIANILAGLDTQQVDSSYFVQPELFYQGGTEVRPGISAIQLVSDQTPDVLLNAFFRTNLQNNGFEVTETQQPYGGGAVYSVKKDPLTLYLNLIPTKDGAGTIVVIWGTPPA